MGNVHEPWIQASFGKHIRVKKIEIAPADRRMAGDWGEEFLQGATIEYYDASAGGWKTIAQSLTVHAGEIITIRVDIQAAIIKIKLANQYGYLGIGCLRFY